jgi:amidase
MKELFDEGDATAIAIAVAKGEVSAREVVDFALARIDERNPSINAIVARRDDAARAEVDAGLPAGPLTGVPVVVKDLGATVAGMPATGGSRLFADVVATEDSEMVARYRRAGAVVVGLTNTPELGRNGSTEPLLFGPARNPHLLTHSTGGSSGGTAAAVAAGIVPAGHANDGGGSIRIPASACGLVGLKPSRGRTPGAPKFNAMAYPLAVNHALTRTVRDCALLLDVAQGPVAGDPYVVAPPLRPYIDEVGAPVERCRVAVSTTTPAGNHVDPDCAAAVERAVALLGELGHIVGEASPEYPLDAIQTAMRAFMAAPLAVDIDARLAELGRELRDDDLEPMTRMIYEGGTHLRGTDVVIAHQELERAAHVVGSFFEQHDLVVTATIARTVPPLGLLDTTNIAAMQRHAGIVAALTSPFNVTGQPAISLPFGVDRHGLPVGVQIVAAFGREDLLLRVAAQLEATGAWDAHPFWPPRSDQT